MELQGEMVKDLEVQEGSVEVQGEVPTGLEAQENAKEDEEVDEVTSSEKKEKEKGREVMEKEGVNPWKEILRRRSLKQLRIYIKVGLRKVLGGN
ncbi:unnamed protein product [Brassica rapa]|uniref:Uncharacterized protein n=1 Tax=Brassica campestris TaxID=3711 RepID=A0A8D9FY10_BRACM|nr:unnamed protein product [Brassica rapa]